MIDHPALIFLFIAAIGFIVAIRQDRRADHRKLLDARARLYQGGELK